MNLLQQYLIEQLLDESLDTAYDYYKDKLSREKFDALIRLDPTFNEEDDRLGTYGKWIITSYLRKTVTEEDLPNVGEILNDFDERKRYITTEGGKDINKYKTLKDIRDVLDTIQLTDNQRERLRRKAKQQVDLEEGAEKLYENSEWVVWIPKTYEASMRLGSGSTWCTASTSMSGKNYFDRYTRKTKEECAELVIFQNKEQKNLKFQAHILYDFSSGKALSVSSFMDVNDNSYSFVEFIFEYDLIDALKKTKLSTLSDVEPIQNLYNMIESDRLELKYTPKKQYTLRTTYFTKDSVPLSSKMMSRLPGMDNVIFYSDTEVNTISAESFVGAKFTTIEFKSSSIKTIGEKAFMDCPNLVEIILPPKLNAITEKAFSNCTSLEKVVLPNSVTYIGHKAFEYCDKVKIYINKRTKKNNIMVTRDDAEFLRAHLVIIGGKKEEPVTESLRIIEDIDYDEVFNSLKLSDTPTLGPTFITKEGKFVELGGAHSEIFDGEEWDSYDYYNLEDKFGMIKAHAGNELEPYPYIDIWDTPNANQRNAIIEWLYFLIDNSEKTLQVNTGDSVDVYSLETELPEDILKAIMRGRASSSANQQATITKEVNEGVLNEVFSPSMPEWLSSALRKNKDNKSTRGDDLRIAMAGEKDSEYIPRTPYGYIDLANAEFVSIPVPDSPRSKYLRAPYIPIFLLKRSGGGGDVFIRDVNDFVPGSGYSYKNASKLSMSELLEITIAFCYLDGREEKNFIDEKFIKSREDSQKGRIKRLPKEVLKKRNLYGARKLDKSGYWNGAVALVQRLHDLGRKDYANTLKKYSNRLTTLRKQLHDELEKVSINQGRYDEFMLKQSYTSLFDAINKYRVLYEYIAKVTSKDFTGDRETAFDNVFTSDVKHYEPYSFETLRRAIVTLENDMKKLMLVPL